MTPLHTQLGIHYVIVTIEIIVLIAIIAVIIMAIITIITATIAIMASQNKSHHKPWYGVRSLCLCVLGGGGGQGSCTARTENYTCIPQVREYRHILRC